MAFIEGEFMGNLNEKIQSFLNQTQVKLYGYSLSQADNYASKNDFKRAISTLEVIPQKSELYAEAQQKIIEYRNALAVKLLQEADNKYHNGRFNEALADLKRIPEGTQVYPQARTKIIEFEKAIRQQAFEKQRQQEKTWVEQAGNHVLANELERAIILLRKIPQTSELYTEAQSKIIECEKTIKQQTIEKQRQQERRLVEQSAHYAASHDFKRAISTLEGIPQSSEIYAKAQQKMLEYRDSLAVFLLQEGIDKYNRGHFAEAVASLKLVPQETLAFQQAQDKISECEEAIRQQVLAKQREQERVLREKQEFIASFKNLVSINHRGKLVAAALVNNLTYVVDLVEYQDYINDTFSETKADGKFVIIRLIVRNDDKKTHTIFSSGINLVDAEDREFSESSSGSTALMMSGDKSAKFMATEVQPGLQKNISIVFDIPVEAKDLKLKIPNGLFGKPTILPLSLAL
ncbi:MAG: DUF4352 domain-containing protein [Coleofasciculus sp. S288]|nr:DUF4352 domain-containing protein [Coleofasciculus sp. S288]